jgi:peptidoglycan/LPS O-acetylase OafA/YrhL
LRLLYVARAFGLRTFFTRRLLRTLPYYYAILAIHLLLPDNPIVGKSIAIVWRFITSTQNSA